MKKLPKEDNIRAKEAYPHNKIYLLPVILVSSPDKKAGIT